MWILQTRTVWNFLKGNDMTRHRAKCLLEHIWVNGRDITPSEKKEIDEVALTKLEFPIDTVLRVSGVDFDWRSAAIVPWARRQVGLAEAIRKVFP